MSWYSWQSQPSKSCQPQPLARTYAARPDSPFWRLRIALATKRRALARSAGSCDLRHFGEVFARFRPVLQHLFARFATIISGCGMGPRQSRGSQRKAQRPRSLQPIFTTLSASVRYGATPRGDSEEPSCPIPVGNDLTRPLQPKQVGPFERNDQSAGFTLNETVGP